jgi:hypothetical protein
MLAILTLGAAEADPLSVEIRWVISRTLLSADLDGDGVQEQVVLVNRLTGKREKAAAMDVLLGIYRGSGDEARLLWSRSILQATGGPCHGGEVTLADLEGNGPPELLLSYSVTMDPARYQRRGELFRWEDGTVRMVWQGVLALDTSRDEGTPPAERTRFERELDLSRTLASRGRTLFLSKRIHVAAGVELPTPRTIEESAPLPPRNGGGA